eukprot:scaffold3356_cov112-Isochrysis_galbana.AAC.18
MLEALAGECDGTLYYPPHCSITLRALRLRRSASWIAAPSRRRRRGVNAGLPIVLRSAAVPASKEVGLARQSPPLGCARGRARLPRRKRLARHNPQAAHLSRERRDARRHGYDGMIRTLTRNSHRGRG